MKPTIDELLSMNLGLKESEPLLTEVTPERMIQLGISSCLALDYKDEKHAFLKWQKYIVTVPLDQQDSQYARKVMNFCNIMSQYFTDNTWHTASKGTTPLAVLYDLL